MPLKLDGTYGVSGVVGTASSAAVYGADVDSGIVFSGNQTLINSDGSTYVTVGAGTTNLLVSGNARVTGILTIGTSSVTLDGTNNQVNVGTGVTIHHSNGVQVGGNTLHSTGLFLNTLNVGTGSTIITTTTGGSVGVGTTNPAGTLHVETSSYPTIKIQNTSTATGFPILQLIDQTTNGRSFQIENGRYSGAINIRDNTTGVDRVTLNSSGNLGIGITNPSNLLTLGASGGPTMRLTDTTSGAFSILIGGSNGDLTFSADHGNTGSSTNIIFSNDGNQERARIDSNGNLAVGTIDATPGRLTVNNVNSASTPTLDLRAPQNNRIVRFKNNAGGDGSLYANGTSTTFDWQFSTYNTANVLYLKNNGNVGMGTDNPSAKLDVEDNTSSGYIAEFRQKHPSNLGTILIDSPSNSSGRSVSLEMSRANTLQWAIGQAYNDSNDSFHIATSSLQSGNTGAKLTIKTNGDVGIGTFNPAYKLDVRGDVSTYGLRMATDLASQTDTGNIASSATNISYRAYGGFQSYTAAVTCNNTWYTLFPNFNYSTGYIIVTAGDAGSKNVQEYAFMTTAPNYGVANFSQLHSMGAWNTGSFELQLSSSGNNYTLQARATSYYSSSNVAGIYMKIISNY